MPRNKDQMSQRNNRGTRRRRYHSRKDKKTISSSSASSNDSKSPNVVANHDLPKQYSQNKPRTMTWADRIKMVKDTEDVKLVTITNGNKHMHAQKKKEVETVQVVTTDTSENQVVKPDLDLNHTWVLWAHDANGSDWTIESYDKVYTVSKASHFWGLFNNITKCGIRVKHLFFMKDETQPTYEDPNNRHGGICSFKVEYDRMIPLLRDIMCRIFLNELTTNDDNEDITGVSISSKSNWGMIKIWNKNSKNDVSKTLCSGIQAQFNGGIYEGVSIKYKETTPEY